MDIRIEMTAQANITAFVARQKVTQFVVTQVSSQLYGEAPDLHVGERLCWSVPVVLTSPARGVVGSVGEILVDAATGEVLADSEAVRRIAEDAEHLAQSAGVWCFWRRNPSSSKQGAGARGPGENGPL